MKKSSLTSRAWRLPGAMNRTGRKALAVFNFSPRAALALLRLAGRARDVVLAFAGKAKKCIDTKRLPLAYC